MKRLICFFLGHIPGFRCRPHGNVLVCKYCGGGL